MKQKAEANSVILVECCGVLEELCGGSEYRLMFPRMPVTIATVVERLTNECPAARDMLERSACAVGDRIVSREQPLQHGERLVLLPPVSGG